MFTNLSLAAQSINLPHAYAITVVDSWICECTTAYVFKIYLSPISLLCSVVQLCCFGYVLDFLGIYLM
jgi:hypothetical protein